VFATIPLAILANRLRVTGTSVAAHFYRTATAEGFLHTFSGWLVFVFTFTILLVLHQLLRWKFPEMISGPIVDRAREPQLTA